MVELVTHNFWWLEVTKEVKQYVEEYNAYQCNKNCTEQLAGKLMPNSIPKKPWMHILADFITKLLLAQGYDSITNGHLLICDWCFRILKGSKMQSLDSDKRCC